RHAPRGPRHDPAHRTADRAVPRHRLNRSRGSAVLRRCRPRRAAEPNQEDSMRTRLTALAALVVGVLTVAALGASAASNANPTKLMASLSGKVETPKGDLTGK